MKKAGYVYLLSGLISGVIFCFLVQLYPLLDLKLSHSCSVPIEYIHSEKLLQVALLLILMQMVIGVFLIFRSSKVEDGKKE